MLRKLITLYRIVFFTAGGLWMENIEPLKRLKPPDARTRSLVPIPLEVGHDELQDSLRK